MLKRSRIDDDDDLGGGAGGGQSDRILVVNSDEDSLELIARLVESRGWRAKRLSDPLATLIELGDQAFAALVVDLPALDDSVDVVRALREDSTDIAKTPVLVLTSTGGDGTPALQAGANGFLARPFHADELFEQLSLVAGNAPG